MKSNNLHRKKNLKRRGRKLNLPHLLKNDPHRLKRKLSHEKLSRNKRSLHPRRKKKKKKLQNQNRKRNSQLNLQIQNQINLNLSKNELEEEEKSHLLLKNLLKKNQNIKKNKRKYLFLKRNLNKKWKLDMVDKYHHLKKKILKKSKSNSERRHPLMRVKKK